MAPKSRPQVASDVTIRPKVHFLDVGTQDYGDSVLCQFGETTVLIDGAHPGNVRDDGDRHPSLTRQIGDILGQSADHCHVSLLIVTHAHLDHIGCLPALVTNNTLRADWALVADPKLGWGKSVTDAIGFPVDLPQDVGRLAAGLREEPLSPDTPAPVVDQFLSDSATLESRYVEMLDALSETGTQVVRYQGRGETARLVEEFASIGLEILGPSEEQLLRCANLIRGRSKDLIDAAADNLRRLGTADLMAPVRAYQQLVTRYVDSLDALGKDKGAINDQSLVLRFHVGALNLLFTGDMQFAKPEVSDQVINSEIGVLRQSIKGRGPYHLVKLAHHGSYNGFSEEILDEVGGQLVLGICTGEGSPSHPNPATLKVLSTHSDEVTWVRTDRNGISTFSTTATGGPQVEVSRGRTNDPRPNSADVPAGAVPVTAGPSAASMTASEPPQPEIELRPSRQQAQSGDQIELVARIPYKTGRVSFSVTIDSQEKGQGTDVPFERPGSETGHSGRTLPRLLFATSARGLAQNIGESEASRLIQALRDSGQTVHDTLPPGGAKVRDVVDQVRAQLSINRGAAGIVLLGGYDLIPAERVDCVPRRLANQVDRSSDPDSFIVWSDDCYGDLDGDGIQELPVSRIPDARSPTLMFSALRIPRNTIPGSTLRRGIRNDARPFAREVFVALPGTGDILKSEPASSSSRPDLVAERVYLMLHGSDVDGTHFWGESPTGYIEAVSTENIADWKGGVVFTGCCWGALTVNTIAKNANGGSLGVRTPGSSLALLFLRQGASAFVGCTGAHYSPTEPPFDYFGGPMHREFWSRHVAGTPPAQALLEAKWAYMQGLPHGQSGPSAEAIELKILHEYTCLGLGW